MRHRWNGSSEREKLSAQRQQWKIRKAVVRRDQLTGYDSLKAERDSGNQEHKESVEREKTIQMQIKSLQGDLKLDRRRTDLQEQINSLRRDVDEEKSLRREWTIRRTAIDVEIGQLKKGPLSGARILGRRPAERPSRVDTSLGPEAGFAPERERECKSFCPALFTCNKLTLDSYTPA
jgi:chromosome segregation ATPase